MRTKQLAFFLMAILVGGDAMTAGDEVGEGFRKLRPIAQAESCDLVRLSGAAGVVPGGKGLVKENQFEFAKIIMETMRRERRSPLPAAAAVEVSAEQSAVIDMPVALVREVLKGFSVGTDVLESLDAERYLAAGPAPGLQSEGAYLLDAGKAGIHFVAITVKPVIGLTASDQPLWLQLESNASVLTGNRLSSRGAIINWHPACLHANIELGADGVDIGSNTKLRGGELRIRPDGLYVSAETVIEQTARSE
ncbi:MAG: hypothetical protein R3E77_00635 [Steroidobacteraceae bacterium]